MRLLITLFLILASLTANAGVMDGIAKDKQEDVLLSCDTEAAKSLLVLRDPKTDTFTILYGKDLLQPEQAIVKLGNDMGTSYHHSAAEATDTREIYSADGQEFTTVGYMDKGGVISAYYKLQTGVTVLISDKCTAASVSSAFDFSEHFANMTEVD
jgi:ATP-dependent protease HslVU (ClpYQ) peptidase subunit